MKNKFISYILLIYIVLISYILFTNKLGYFLAPQMHKYIYIALPLLILMLLTIMHNEIHYHYKFSDVFLLIPLVAIILAGDCKLSLSYSSNSLGNFSNRKEDNTIVVDILPDDTDEKNDNSTKDEEDTDNILKEENNDKEIENYENINFNTPYFTVKDDIFVNLTEYLSFDKKSLAYEGKTIKMKGFTVSNSNIPKGYKIFGKYQISCCVADSFISGMLIKYDGILEENTWYEVEGILEKIPDSKFYYLGIKVVNIKKIDEEEMYVYPCYAYGDGSCKSISSLNLK